MKAYYYVYRYGHEAPSRRHETLLSAKQEAERLANQHPGSAFEILACLGFSQTSRANTFWADGVKFDFEQ